MVKFDNHVTMMLYLPDQVSVYAPCMVFQCLRITQLCCLLTNSSTINFHLMDDLAVLLPPSYLLSYAHGAEFILRIYVEHPPIHQQDGNFYLL